MKPATSGAKDPLSTSTSTPSPLDNSGGTRRRHRGLPPDRATEGRNKRAPRHTCRSRSRVPARKSRTIAVNESLRSADRREREPESRGGAAAVQPDGAEADVVRPNRADAAGEDWTDSSAPRRRSALRLCCLTGDPSQCRNSSSFPGEEKGREPGKEGDLGEGSGASAGCGLDSGLWRGGCLQAELIQFHLQKRRERSGAKMQSKADNMGAEEAAVREPEPAADATEAGTVTQQDQALEDEIERLLEENEDLKV